MKEIRFEDDLYGDDEWFYYKGQVNPVVIAWSLINVYHPKYNFLVTTDDKEIWMYNGSGYYEPLGERFLSDKIEKILGIHYHPSSRYVVLEWVKDNSLFHTEREVFDNNINLINLKNGIYNINNNKFIKHSKKYYHTYQLPITYNPDAKINKIEKFLSDVLYKDDIPLIQELTGYLLYRDYPFHKAFMFVGDGSNGKSTLINLLTTFLGKRNVSQVSLQDIANRQFDVSELYRKLSNTCSDLPDVALHQTGLFKMLTGGDYVSAHVKYKPMLEFKNYAKLMFSTNKIPMAKDDSDAFYRRWAIISFPNRFERENCNPNILKELTTDEELSGLFNWAMEGLHRLLDNGVFSYTKTTDEIRDEYERKSSPMIAFVKDMVTFTLDSNITKSDLYQAYVEYCTKNKLPPKVNHVFSRELKMYLKVDDGHSNKQRIWKNIALNPEKEEIA